MATAGPKGWAARCRWCKETVAEGANLEPATDRLLVRLNIAHRCGLSEGQPGMNLELVHEHQAGTVRRGRITED